MKPLARGNPVKTFILLLSLGLALVMPGASQAADPPPPGGGIDLGPKSDDPDVMPPAGDAAAAIPSRIVCFTCARSGAYSRRTDWPRISRGYLLEYGPNCAAPQRWVMETRPQICAYR